MSKELELKVYSNKELAEWFGITANSFSNQKQKKLEELKAFADFEQVGNKQKKIKIKKIYEPIYRKRGSQAYEKIRKVFDKTWSEDGLDSCRRVCYQILDTQNLSFIEDETAYRYTLKSRNDLYGKPFQEPGILGRCEYTWCKQEKDGSLRFLTKEEQDIKTFLIKKYFGDASEKQIIVQAMVDSGEITQEEAWRVLTRMTNMKGNNFLAFLKQLQKKIGCRVIRGTFVQRYVEKKENAF